MTIHERQQLMIQEFSQRFHDDPTLWVQAPGRVDLMGSHTDYNEGFVMTMSINRDTWIALRPRDDRRVRISSLNLEGGGELDLENIVHDQLVPWTNYVRGVAKVLQDEGHPLKGFVLIAPVLEIRIRGDVLADTLPPVVHPDHRQLLRLRIGQRAPQHAVDYAEDGRVRADAERQRQDGD